MAEQMPPDPEQVLASFMERHQQMITAGRRATLDGLQAYEQTLSAFADSQEQLAAASEVEWLSRLLTAQAGFTREVVNAISKFTHDVMEA
ncbi:MAG TPA: hypothetical protein VK631_04475 [Solirubrobacteraceae bacterium]|nr:hypothetical protein [Solirubrobacteraceae bacterium]